MSSNKRAALVIGNGEYNEGPLTNPPRDATAIEGLLQDLEFKTVGGQNLDRASIFDYLNKFEAQFEDRQISLLFYAGHGIQYEQKNFLVPVEAKIRYWHDVEQYGIDLDSILRRFKRLASTVIFFLDCCRNNPFQSPYLPD